MATYNESAVSGTTWTRCNSIHISNPYLGVPHIVFGEEEILNIASTSPVHISKNQDIHAVFDAINGNIPILNPYTGEATGSVLTHTELYSILYSLYIQKARERDLYVPVSL